MVTEMEETIAKWIIEYLIRKKSDDKITNLLLTSLPLSNSDHRLKKTMLLRRIETETSGGCVSEKVLEFMETIEELDHGEGRLGSEAMKEAYCMAGVDCTVRFLEEGGEEERGRYVEAVERVWRRRVVRVEGLWSEGVERWGRDIEAAVWDGAVCGRILRRNTRSEAVRAVRVFLREEWEGLGPSFLEVVAARAGVGEGEVNRCRDLVAFEGTPKCQAPVRRKRVATKSRRRRGAKITEPDEETMNNANDNQYETATPNMDRVQEVVRSSPMEKHAVGNCLSGDIRKAQTPSSSVPTGNYRNVVENQTGAQLPTTPEVVGAQEALKISTKGAIAAQPLSSKKPTRKIRTAVENLAGLGAQAIPEAYSFQQAQQRTQRVATNNTRSAQQSIGKDSENVEKKDNLNDDPGGYLSPDPRKQDNLRKRNLMEPNGTCYTYEWGDSFDDMNAGSANRPHLPSPKLRRVSPLKKPEDRNFQKRRERKMWTPVEEDTLRIGVQKFGKGNWKLILNCYHEIFDKRTEVDLKDKWRNMTKSS